MASDQFTMRARCKRCGVDAGYITPTNGQNVVRCAGCHTYCYSAPRTETGEAQRSITTVHAAIKPKQRERVLRRCGGRCLYCGKCGAETILHVSHILSAKDGFTFGLADWQINHDDNLIALCEECNLGMGSLSLPLWLAAALLRRVQNVGE